MVIVIEATASPLNVAVPVAVTPPVGAALKVTVGAELYPEPPAVIVDDATELVSKFELSAKLTFNELPQAPGYLATHIPLEPPPVE